MNFKISTFLAFAAAMTVLAAPATPGRLSKRDTCDLRGWHKVEIVVGSGGPGQAPVSYTYNGFDLNYEGGVPIGSNKDDIIPIRDETIPAGKLGQPNEIKWEADWDLTSFRGCKATYNGETYDGEAGSCGDGTLGTTCSQCTVKIECEGGL